ncbi:outer membrane protein assembly factor BamD [Allorhodopirellula solitaria]|uniref:Tetratricopeptide repeat protein n=1 Tax=Allorhodopirellula solitaria TaxID=2527987 RepID=A0A5C5XW04_9BACT|nr:hypothetical protein [Allorhodopirellula solitaria]TWT66175.1 hypothetical protein CA85_30390 [Allorhodopirellula solitaria]
MSAVLVLGAIGATQARAQGEPAADFVKRLRAAEYYDLAIAYLDRLDQYPGVDSAFTTTVPLEKAQTYIESAGNARSVERRDEAFAKAEAQLQVFLKNHPGNPRASEARAQLGKLRLFRGSQFMIGELDDDKRKQAREQYQAASKTFETIINDLKGKLEDMKVADIDPEKNPEKAELRDRYRGEFLMALQSSGEAKMLAAETYQDPVKEAPQMLEQALGTYTDLSEKYDNYVLGAAAFYPRGKVEQLLGKRDQAYESYTRMLEQSDTPEFRDAKIGAAAGLVSLLLSGKKQDYAEAIKVGAPVEASLRPNEQRSQIAQDLRVELARAYLAKNADEQNTKPNERKRALSDARKLLMQAKRIPGTHDEAAVKLLADIGIDAAAAEETADTPTADDPKSFAEALASARELFQTEQLIAGQIKALQDQDGDAEQVKSLQESLDSTRQTGVVILRRGLSMIGSDTDSAEINEARQFLAFLLLQEKRYRDSFVVGSALAQFAPGSDVGLSGGLIALNSAQQIISAEGTGSDYWVERIKQLGDFLVQKWPDNPKAASAQGISIAMALKKNDLADAKRMIDAMPESPEQAQFRRSLGLFYWNDSLRLLREEKDQQADDYWKKAAAELTAGLNQIQGGLVDADAMNAALVLAKIRLRQDRPDAAVKVLDHPKYGPIPLQSKLEAPSQSFLFDLYRTELQAVASQLTSSDGDQEKLLARATHAIEQLQETASDDAGKQKLVQTFRTLAVDIQKQIENAPPARQAKLIDAFNVFLSQISKISQDDTTLLWVGQTMLGMAESAMPEGQVKAEGQTAELLKTAIETFQTLKQKPDASETIPYLLGKALRLQGQYSAALKEFREILTTKPTMIDAQEEAALTYEQWAAVLPAKYKPDAYESALGGGKKGVIWGWGKISVMTQRNPNFRDRFFNARYHLARCRYMQGEAAKDPKLTQNAARVITSLAGLYPDLGGPDEFRKFNALLKKIQIAAGENPDGLPPANGD